MPSRLRLSPLIATRLPRPIRRNNFPESSGLDLSADSLSSATTAGRPPGGARRLATAADGTMARHKRITSEKTRKDGFITIRPREKSLTRVNIAGRAKVSGRRDADFEKKLLTYCPPQPAPRECVGHKRHDENGRWPRPTHRQRRAVPELCPA